VKVSLVLRTPYEGQSGVELIVATSVVVFREAIMRAECDELLVETAISVTEALLTVAPQVFEMKPDCSRVVEIGRKVVSGPGLPATDLENGASNIGR
jgi:hypothetical protein